MSNYKDIFLPTTNALNEVNKTTVFIAMLVIVGASIIYIMFGVKQLKKIFVKYVSIVEKTLKF